MPKLKKYKFTKAEEKEIQELLAIQHSPKKKYFEENILFAKALVERGMKWDNITKMFIKKFGFGSKSAIMKALAKWRKENEHTKENQVRRPHHQRHSAEGR